MYERLTRGAPLTVILAAGLLVAYRLLPVLELVALAMLVALVLRTLVNGLRKVGVGPWASSLLLLAALGAFAGFVWLVLVPNLLREIYAPASAAPGYVDSLVELSDRLRGGLGLVPPKWPGSRSG